MTKMFSRTVFPIGAKRGDGSYSSCAVVLPREWVLDVGIKPGDLVEFTKIDEGIALKIRKQEIE
jgi:hypothetical protein